MSLRTPAALPRLTGAKTLLRGAVWNQLGQVLPVLAALVLIPPLIRALGVDRSHASLAWMLIGYFTLFDLGVSGALTRLVSERMTARREADVPALVSTALGLTTVMGLMGAGLVTGAAPWLVGRALRIPVGLPPEALRLTWVLASSLPVVTGTAALAGVLAAQQRFGVLNAIRVPMGILTYLGPCWCCRYARPRSRSRSPSPRGACFARPRRTSPPAWRHSGLGARTVRPDRRLVGRSRLRRLDDRDLGDSARS